MLSVDGGQQSQQSGPAVRAAAHRLSASASSLRQDKTVFLTSLNARFDFAIGSLLLWGGRRRWHPREMSRRATYNGSVSVSFSTGHGSSSPGGGGVDAAY